MQRVYCVGHESAHRKLYPQNPIVNNVVGQLFLWVLLVPLSIFRKIHDFHHAANRRDEQTSALDIYVIPANATRLQRLCALIFLWYGGILCGGWFSPQSNLDTPFFNATHWHCPNCFPRIQRMDITRSNLGNDLLLLHRLVSMRTAILFIGFDLWSRCYLIPLAIFAVVYSLQLYIYHYRTTTGPKTLFHARRLSGPKWVSWWLLNLNEHDTHHQRPKIVWYALPDCHKPYRLTFSTIKI